MKFALPLRQLMLVGVFIEILIVAVAIWQYESPGEIFRHAARWSGRLSLCFYLLAAVVFIRDERNSSLINVKHVVIVFCVLHFIHLGFVVLNVYVHDIALVPFKLAGGALAYAMILFYPFIFDRVKDKLVIHLIYFYYVGLVMAVTILARLRGDFEGAEPSVFHYIGIAMIAVLFLWMGVSIIRKNRRARESPR